MDRPRRGPAARPCADARGRHRTRDALRRRTGAGARGQHRGDCEEAHHARLARPPVPARRDCAAAPAQRDQRTAPVLTAERRMARSDTAFLFDLDGTLVDSVYQHVLAWKEALDAEEIELSVWRIHRKIGMSGGLFTNQ